MSGTILTTVSGRSVDLLHPKPEDVDFDDIAEHLAKENRFNGATPGCTYSVAEHLVRGARAVFEAIEADPRVGVGWIEPGAAARYFLVHDFPEAYLKDDTTPKKRALDGVARGFGAAAELISAAIEGLTMRWEWAIAEASGLPWPPEPAIKALVARFDRIMLNTEWRDLRPGTPLPHAIGPGEEPLAGRIEPWSWERAQFELRAEIRKRLRR